MFTNKSQFPATRLFLAAITGLLIAPVAFAEGDLRKDFENPPTAFKTMPSGILTGN